MFYVLEVEYIKSLEKIIDTYIIFTKTNEFSYFKHKDESIKKLFFTSFCINNNNKKFWDLAETPMWVDKKN